jgi:hypothetical protein
VILLVPNADPLTTRVTTLMGAMAGVPELQPVEIDEVVLSVVVLP